MRKILKKFTSRKFLAAFAGVSAGIYMISCGSVSEGTTAIVASVVSYLAAEGIIDAKSAGASADEKE
jgi:Na+/phosphate symporter